MKSESVDSFEGREGRWFLTLGILFAFVIVCVESFNSKPALANAPIVHIGNQLASLDNPVATTGTVEFTVPATSTSIRSITPTTGTWGNFDVVYIANSLTTCIRVSLGDAATTTNGFDIGSGCRDGVGVTIEAKGDQVFVIDDGGGTVAGVDAVWGKR